MRRQIALCLAILLCLTAVAQAVPTIVIANHNFEPNTAGQLIPLNVTGIEPNTVNGMTLAVTINGGGVAYGGLPGPIITDIDFDSGPTIWVPPSAPTGHNPPWAIFGGQFAIAEVSTNSGFVAATNGRVATLTVDMTGFFVGVWTVELIGTMFHETETGDSSFIGNITEQILISGTISIVPEPSSVVLGVSAIAAFSLVAIRKRRAHRT